MITRRRTAVKRLATAVCLQQPFPAQLSDLGGKTAAVHFQVICQLLTVKGDGKAGASLLFSLEQQVCPQLIPGGAAGSDSDLLMKQQVFGGYHLQQVVNDLLMKSTGIAAGVGHTGMLQQQGFTVLYGYYAYRQRLHIGAGKGLPKKLPGLHGGYDAAVAEIIGLQDLQAAGKQDAHAAGRLSFCQHRLLPGIGDGLCPQAVKHGAKVFLLNVFKQWTFF